MCYICGHRKPLCAVDFRCPYHCAPTEHESVAEHVEEYWIMRELDAASRWLYVKQDGSGAARGEEKTAPLLAHDDATAAPPPGFLEG